MSTTTPILQIPLQGGSGYAPSGPVQFRGDWPGLFLRGDHAISIAQSIRHLSRCVAADTSDDTIDAVKRLEWLASIVEDEVKTPPSKLT